MLAQVSFLCRKSGNDVVAIAVGHPQSQSEDRYLRQQFRLIHFTSRHFIVSMSTALWFDPYAGTRYFSWSRSITCTIRPPSAQFCATSPATAASGSPY